ncbi:uncharacterized protein LOC131952791 [Physella acuta]|uniref:uncharacterized protein LOC131952791 n=1 Tax=Physella acuta TaxID=109671 RepID=UPI0027DB6B57|nr:uncharacterized protein LOC131952791 [Physella acuta]
MASRLAWFTDSKTRGETSWRPWKVKLGLVLIAGTLMVMVMVFCGVGSYDPLGLYSLIVTVSKFFSPHTQLLIPSVLAITVFIMVSILHVVFKLPVLSWSRSPTTVTPAPESHKQLTPRCPDNTAEEATRRENVLEHGEDKSRNQGNCMAEKTRTIVNDVPLTENIQTDLQTRQHTQTDFTGHLPRTTLAIQKTSKTDLKIKEVVQESAEPEATVNDRSTLSRDKVVHVDTGTQTDDVVKTRVATVGTMTSSPLLADVSVNTHQRLCKIVKTCGTTTSGPFMKKLRRAQRLLKEARVKTKQERQLKVTKWRAVMDRYKEKLSGLFETLEKKDRMLGYIALNRALSENEVKEICSAVRTSRDRLLTQCKLNSALREVIESKSEHHVSPVAVPTPAQQACR